MATYISPMMMVGKTPPRLVAGWTASGNEPAATATGKDYFYYYRRLRAQERKRGRR